MGLAISSEREIVEGVPHPGLELGQSSPISRQFGHGHVGVVKVCRYEVLT